MSPCCHHWMIPTPEPGPGYDGSGTGTCRKCGAERLFVLRHRDPEEMRAMTGAPGVPMGYTFTEQRRFAGRKGGLAVQAKRREAEGQVGAR